MWVIIKSRKNKTLSFTLKSFNRCILIFLFYVLSGITVSAQTNWHFTPINGTFVPLTGKTQAEEIQNDDAVSDVINIGFTFSYNRVNYTQLVASSNGFLSFNTSASSSYNNDLTNSSARPLVAPLWDDLSGEDGIAGYKTEGVTPNRVFTFEWLNWKWCYGAPSAVVSFQVKLYETSNIIEFCYRQESEDPDYPSASIGLSFQNTGSDNFLSLTGAGPNPEFSTTTESSEIDSKPATGQIYRFEFVVKPEPSQHAADFSGVFSNYNIILAWTDAGGSQIPDGYVIYASTINSFINPVDGVNVTTDNNLSDGNGIVKVAQGIQSYSSWMNFQPGTIYYFRIYPYTNEGELIDYKTDGTIPEAQVTTPASIYPFSERSEISLTSVSSSSVEWGDYNNDGFLDILLTGNTGSSYISKIYQNTTTGNFTEVSGLPLTGVGYGYVKWGDYDSDNDLDIFLAGFMGTGNISKIYQNNTGSFLDINANLVVGSKAADWGDYDNDGDLDLLITANPTTRGEVSLIYRNDNGIFTNINAGLRGLSGNSVDWGDFDSDGDLDILLSGQYLGAYSYYRLSKAYRNDNGIFNELDFVFPEESSGYLSWFDYDGDGDLDILFASDGGIVPYLKVYRNENGIFSDAFAFSSGIFVHASAFGDYDNDGDIDVLLSGELNSQPVTKLYSNNSGLFSEVNTNLPAVRYGTVDFGDYDNDGDLDILITGDSGSGYLSRIYRNETINTNVKPSKPQNPTVIIDNEKINFIWNKSTDNSTPDDGLSYNLYIYDQEESVFKRSPQAIKQTEVLNGKRLISDIGNIQWSENGYILQNLTPDNTYKWSVQAIDASFTGGEFADEQTFYLPYYRPALQASNINFTSNKEYSKVTVTWSNGNGAARAVFIKESASGKADPLDNITYAVDSYTPGGWQCIFNGTGNSVDLTGLIPGVDYTFNICEYNGSSGSEKYATESANRNPMKVNTVFTDINLSVSTVTYPSSTTLGDYDNDGDLDILLTGSNGSVSSAVTKIYRNDTGVFTDINASLPGVMYSSAAWGDYDGDGDLDILLAGATLGGHISRIYRNNSGTFSDINAGFTGVYHATTDWVDYDNDGDLDVLITGATSSGACTKIYRNDAGSFTDAAANLPGISGYGSIAWGDFDNDGDLDLNGYCNDPDIYRNDGGSFTGIDVGIDKLFYGSVAWSDYDSDGDLDLLLTGQDESGNKSSKIYRNDAGVFNDIYANMAPMVWGSASWGDFDNDGDPDVLLSGSNDTVYLSKIYKNDSGIFNPLSSQLNEIQSSFLLWGDYDNDGDLDIIQTGKPETGGIRVYQNNMLNHNQLPSVPGNLQTSVVNESVTFKWTRPTDNETDQNGINYNLYVYDSGQTTYMCPPHAFSQNEVLNGRRLIAKTGNIQWNENGYTLKYLPSEKQYYWSVQAIDAVLAGSEFAPEQSFYMPAYKPRYQSKNVTFTNIQQSQVSVSWTNGSGIGRVIFVKEKTDEAPDLLDNTSYSLNYITPGGWKCVYSGTGNSADITGLTPGTVYTVFVCEYNGSPGSEKYLTTKGENNPGMVNPIFSVVTTSLAGVQNSSLAWGDYDGDGDLDLVMTGESGTQKISKLYKNNGGTFSEVSAGFTPVTGGSAEWGDYDNDQDLDLLLTGYTGWEYIVKIYKNTGGVFGEAATGISGFNALKGTWSDYDNDGDLDILLTGYVTSSVYISKIFSNDYGVFNEVNAGLTGVWNSTATLGDYDNDGDLDILLAGAKSSNEYDGISILYRNDGNYSFNAQTDYPLAGAVYSSCDLADFDNDGDLDMIITGMTVDYKSTAKIYRNNSGIFIDDNDGLSLTGTHRGVVKCADFNNDGNMDILSTGFVPLQSGVTKLYKNNMIIPNDKPSAPGNLTSIFSNNTTQLNWDKANDSKTAQNGLSYNVYIGTTPGSVNKKSPMSQLTDGYRKIVRRGEVQANSYTIKLLPVGTYYWSVQALDASYSGSLFATEQSFTVVFTNLVSPVNDQILEPGQNGPLLSVTESGTASSRQWQYSPSPEGPFTNIPGATNTGYTPNFTDPGTYYIVCESVYNTVKYRSNWVRVLIPYFSDKGTIIPALRNNTAAWGDYDHDGDLDVVYFGYTGTEKTTEVYRNDAGVYNDINAGLPGFDYGSVSWGDYDNDGDLDILIYGSLSSTEYPIKVYRNDNGVFSEAFSSLTDGYDNKAIWADFDSDGDLDILDAKGKAFQNTSGIFTARDIGISENSQNVAAADYDNDGDMDIIYSSGNLYRNDNNVYTSVISATELIYNGSIDWGDYDSDGDLDLLMTGGFNSKIYQNNSGSFIDINAGLTGVSNGYAAWGDYDNDGDLDIILTGNKLDYSGQITKLYTNKGNNVFSEHKNLPFINVDQGLAAWGDYDGDKDLDILLIGSSASGYISRIYRNNSLTPDDPPDPPQDLSYLIQFKDLLLKWDRGDDDKTSIKSLTYNLRIGTSSLGSDYIPSHSLNSGQRMIVEMGNVQLDTAFVLRNVRWNTYYASVQAIDNSFKGGSFSDEIQFEFYPVQPSGLTGTYISSSSILLRWIRGNGDYCVVFAKEGVSGDAAPVDNFTYYYNAIFGEGSPIGSTGWYCIYKGIADSVLLTGLGPGKNYIVHAIEFQGKNGSEKYATLASGENKGIFSTSLFIEQTGISLPGVEGSAIGWADYDNDGDLDLLLAGSTNSSYISKIYRNNSNNTFTETYSLPGAYYGSVSWCDYDNNGSMDVLLSGEPEGGENFSEIFRNGDFTSIGAGLDGIAYGSTDWGDYDNDGDLDILLTGSVSFPVYRHVSEVYRNDAGVFHQSFIFPELRNGAGKWGDYDNDGDLDVLLIGDDLTNGVISKIYRNDNGVFTDINAGLKGVEYGSLAWFDYNNDSNQDIIFCGEDENNNPLTRIYKNNGDKTFSEQTQLLIKGLSFSSISTGDYDNDGYQDILISGTDDNSDIFTKVYHNNRDGSFSELMTNVFSGVTEGAISWVDYDNDGDLDILITGIDNNGLQIAKIYRNNLIMKAGTFKPNKKPSAPGNLKSTVNPGKVTLDWSAVNADETPPLAMSYNIRYRIAGETAWKSAPHASENGYRRVPLTGNLQLNKKHILKNLPAATYSWQVQAVDQGYKGGEWSDVASFEVKNVQAFFSSDTVCYGYATQFVDNSVATDGIASWKWDFKDGTTSSDKNPVHSYSIGGTYNVKLVITDNNGVKDSLEQYVIVKYRPSTEFMAPNVCEGITTTFTNNTIINGLTISSWLWDFGDGQTSIVKDPVSHTYSLKGIYKTKLKATATNGCADSITQDVIVAAIPNSSVSVNGKTIFCQGDSVLLTAEYNPVYSYQWKLDGNDLINTDTSAYKVKLSSGSYSVRVTNTLANCMSTSGSTNVTVNTVPLAPYISADGPVTFCNGDSVVLSVTAAAGNTYQWKHDGGGVGNNTSQYVAKSSGVYSLTVSNTSGCSVDAINMITVTANMKPAVPAVSLSGQTTFCQGSSLNMSVSNNTLYTYQWQKNGSDITGAKNPSYIATESGIYSLNITNLNECSSKTESITVNVLAVPSAPAISTSGPLIFCEGDSVLMSVTNTAGYTYQWKLNGGSVGIDSCKHSAKTTGTYLLSVTNSAGCSVNSTNSVPVTVNSRPAVPVVSISGPATFCEGGSVDLSVTENPAYSYQWERSGAIIQGAITSSCKIQTSGDYSLMITNSSGCSKKTENVVVNVLSAPASPVISTSGNIEFCQGDSVELSVTNTLNQTYQWKKDGGAIGLNSSKFIARNSGLYNLTVTNANNCSVNSTNSVTVNVNPAPSAGNISLNGPDTFCEGGSATLSVPTMAENTYKWKNASVIIPGAETSNYTAFTSGSYSLNITNASGCMAETSPVKITVNPSPVKPVITTSNYSPGECLGTIPIKLDAGNAVPGYRYGWIKDGEPRANDTLTHIEFYEKGIYKLRAGLGVCQVESEAVTITLPDAPDKPVVYVKGPVVWYMAAYSKTATRYQWYRNDELITGATRYIYVANKTLGTYKVAVGNENECYVMSDPRTIPLSKGEMTDFHVPAEFLVEGEAEIEGSIKLYPNPTKGIFTIEIDNNLSGELYINIITEQGKEIRNINTQKTSRVYITEIDIGSQPKGVFFINLRIDKYTATRKIILE